jgi:hypothetical protein
MQNLAIFLFKKKEKLKKYNKNLRLRVKERDPRRVAKFMSRKFMMVHATLQTNLTALIQNQRNYHLHNKSLPKNSQILQKEKTTPNAYLLLTYSINNSKKMTKNGRNVCWKSRNKPKKQSIVQIW